MKTTTKRKALLDFSTFSLFNLSFCTVAMLCAATAHAMPHVEETLELTKGWNAIYVEATPTNSLCVDFFRDTPVLGAAMYLSDAGSATAQYDSAGDEIVQAPVAFLQWIRGENVSTLQAISGGSTLLLYADEATTITNVGVPVPPRMTWHKVAASETNELFNLAGVSSAGKTVSIDKYFGEGPFGASTPNRAICSIYGTDEDAGPDYKDAENAGFGRKATISGGKAYALTATSSGDWPGVIGVLGDGAFFGADANYASVKVRNCGTRSHAFRFTMVESATKEALPPISRQLPRTDALGAPAFTNVAENLAWTVSLDPGDVTEQIFRLDRSQLAAGTEYGAILVIEDMDGSEMRVRLPIAVAIVPENAIVYPTGLWVGEIAFSQVSGLDDPTPMAVAPGAELKMNVMMHVDADAKCTLLQRVAVGIDTNGTARLFRELDDVPPEVENPRRFSTVMMSVDTPVVEAAAGSAFGDGAAFSWTIAPTARDNPFRHAWHPDHDGKKADYSGDAPSGDDFANYAYPIKPELWSITNRLDLSWHEQGDPALPAVFPYNADETTSGVVTWEVEGLAAKGPIKSVGTFHLRRVFAAKEVE